jgi:hypothetical protein
MKQVIFLLSIIFILGCNKRSELKHETGYIIEKQFSPEFNGSGSGLGITTGGDLVISESAIHEKEHFMLVVKCEHNTIFTIDRKDLYAKLDKGDTIDIKYYEYTNSEGKVVRFDFVNATKK